MDRTRVLAFTAVVLFVLCLAAPAGAKFIGTGVTFDKHFGDTINVNVGTGVSALDNTAFGLADMDLGITWGLDLDLGTMAGYPYGYGGIGAVSTGGLGYSLGMSMDETHGAGFDGSGYGIPLAEQGVTTTHFGQLWSNNLQLDNSQAVLPFSSFPVL
jgi:hypothetical protein